MKKYEVPAILDGKTVKFSISVPDNLNDYQVQLLLLGKYKSRNLVLCTERITPIIELDFS